MLTDSNLHSQCLVKLQLNLIRIKMEPFWGSFRASKLVCFLLVCLTAESLVSGQTGAGTLYRGKYIGKIQARQHKVSGDVYAVDARTLHIRAFTYDGTGPDAFFWTGFTENPSPEGIIIPDENGSKAVLGAYNARDITLTLPDGLTLREVKWLSIWCRAYEVNFGDMYIPADLDYPQPHVIGSLSGQHGVASGPIVVVDAQTILVPDFTYDGQAPDVHFWVGRGKPGPEGIRVPDETGGDTPLTKSDKKTMVLTLPGDLTIFDIDFFGVWCRLYYVDFGHVKILPGLNVPPSLRMLGVTPQPSGVAALSTLSPVPPVGQFIQEPTKILQLNPLPPPRPPQSPAYVQTQTLPVTFPQQQLSQPQFYTVIQNHGQILHPTEVPTELSPIHPQVLGPQYNEQLQVVHPSPPPQPQLTHHQVQIPTTTTTTTPIAQFHHHRFSIRGGQQQPQPQQFVQDSAPPLGTNGFSSITFRTSKGQSSSLSLY